MGKRKLIIKDEKLRIDPRRWEKAAPEICENIRRVRLAAKKFEEERKKWGE